MTFALPCINVNLRISLGNIKSIVNTPDTNIIDRCRSPHIGHQKLQQPQGRFFIGSMYRVRVEVQLHHRSIVIKLNMQLIDFIRSILVVLAFFLRARIFLETFCFLSVLFHDVLKFRPHSRSQIQGKLKSEEVYRVDISAVCPFFMILYVNSKITLSTVQIVKYDAKSPLLVGGDFFSFSGRCDRGPHAPRRGPSDRNRTG